MTQFLIRLRKNCSKLMIRKTRLLYGESDDIWTASIEHILAVKLFSNWAATRKLLHYVLQIPIISEQLINNELLEVVKNISARVNVKFKWTNQSCSLSEITQLLDIQWRNRDINSYFYESKKIFVRLIKWN